MTLYFFLDFSKPYFFPRKIHFTAENRWFYVAWDEVLLRWLMYLYFKELVVVDTAEFIYPFSPKKKK